MATILNRVLTYTPVKPLSLGGEEFARRIWCGNTWGRIRIGMLFNVTADSTNNLTGRCLNLGLCSGTREPSTHYTTKSFIGASLVGEPFAGGTLTYTAGSGAPYYTSAAGRVFRRTRNSNISSATGGGTTTMFPDDTGTPKRVGMFIIDINKLTGTLKFATAARCTVNCYHVATGMNATALFRPDELQEAVDSFGAPTIRGTALTAWTSVTDIGGTDTMGALDTISLYYNMTTAPMVLYALCASVMYDLGYYDNGGAYDSFATSLSEEASGSQAFTIRSGGYWDTWGSFAGTVSTGYLTPFTRFGTILGPYDSFEQYGVGTVLSGNQPTGPIILGAGTGWSGNAVISP